jgi:hypothetical protein
MKTGMRFEDTSDNPLQCLQNQGDENGTHQDRIGRQAMGVNVLCLCQHVSLKEKEVRKGKKHEKQTTGIADYSRGLL